MFNGSGTRGTTFQINGVNNDDSSENQHRQGVALATIKSFQILSNSYSAEFGRGYGAVVLVQTKSGTNELAGEVYGYFQDNEYNAKGELDLTKPARTKQQYGFTSGFPILRDTLFGYVNADHLDFEGADIVTRPIWTAADLALPRLTLGNDTPENRETAGETALYFDVAREGSLAAALEGVRRDPEAARARGRAAAERAARCFGWERIADAYAALLRNLVAGSPAGADRAAHGP